MKRVFTSPDSAELELLENMLQKTGIRCVEINPQMAQPIPSAPFQAELSVDNDADYPTAAAILEEWQRPTLAVGAAWICSRCGEKLENQFGKCWKCGANGMPPLEGLETVAVPSFFYPQMSRGIARRMP